MLIVNYTDKHHQKGAKKMNMVNKNLRKIVAGMVIAGFVLEMSTVSAATDSSITDKAYADAISSGIITYEDDYSGVMQYSLADIDSDGTEEFLFRTNSEFSVWDYKGGKVKLDFKYDNTDPIVNIYYDDNKKMFWLSGEGDGAWFSGLVQKKKTLKEKISYYIGYKSENKMYAQKTQNGKTTVISVKKYRKTTKKIMKNTAIDFNDATQSEVIDALS